MHVQAMTAHELATDEGVKQLLAPVASPSAPHDDFSWVPWATVDSQRLAIADMQTDRARIQQELTTESAEKARLQALISADQVCSHVLVQQAELSHH